MKDWTALSSISWQDLRDTDFGVLESLAVSWAAYVASMADQADVLTAKIVKEYIGSDHYESETAECVRNQLGLVAESFQDDLYEYATVKIKATLEEAHTDLTAAQIELGELLASIEAGKYSIAGSPDGYDVVVSEGLAADIGVLNVSAALMSRAGVTEADFASDFGRNEARVRLAEAAASHAGELAGPLRAIMTRARRADDTAAEILRSLIDGPAELPPLLGATYDDLFDEFEQEAAERNADFLRDLAGGDSDASPYGVNEWWDGLSEGERETLIEDHPELLGPVDGIPADVRDTANRALLEAEIGSLEDRLAGAPASERSALAAKIEALRGLEGTIAGQADTGQDYFLLGFDSADEGQAIVAIGNPDSADNVNVYVPGTGGSLADASGGLMERAESMAYDAQFYAPDRGTATVLWMGYDAPDNVHDEARDTRYAEEAADDLGRFADGIRATAEDGSPNIIATGHSYGSTTVGIAARDGGLGADNMIFVGSPGVGVGTAEELGIDPDNVWATRNGFDVIEYGMVHGEDPTSDEFGGNSFRSAVTRDVSLWNPLPGMIDNHSAYWDDANAVGRRNMAHIVTGRTDGVR